LRAAALRRGLYGAALGKLGIGTVAVDLERAAEAWEVLGRPRAPSPVAHVKEAPDEAAASNDPPR
jgi:hypothetical protein